MQKVFVGAVLLLMSNLVKADYGIPYIFSSCSPSLDYAAFELDLVNNPPNSSGSIENGIIRAKQNKNIECHLNDLTLKLSTFGEDFLSLQIGDKQYINKIPLIQRGLFFEKLIFDGDSIDQDSGSPKTGTLHFCFLASSKKSSIPQRHTITLNYPNDAAIDKQKIRSVIKASESRPFYANTCSLFDRF